MEGSGTELSVVVEGGVAAVLIDRPAASNALSPALAIGLAEVFRGLAVRDDVRVVTISSTGRNFMAGGDIADFGAKLAQPEGEIGIAFSDLLHRLAPAILAICTMPKPVVCAVQGAAAGAGMSFVLAADFAIASDDGFFSLAHVNIAASPDAGSTYLLPRLVGRRRAIEIAMLGERIDAATAERFGLVNSVVPRADLEAARDGLVARLLSQSATSLAHVKSLLNAAEGASLAEQLENEKNAFVDCAVNGDMQEGVRAFLERRPARYGNKMRASKP